jgi:hypothetical protein
MSAPDHAHYGDNLSRRLRSRINRDFPIPGSADEVAHIVGEAADSERVQAAIVLWAAGDLDRLREVVTVTQQDWRDTLVRSGLVDDDWPERLSAELGPN